MTVRHVPSPSNHTRASTHTHTRHIPRSAHTHTPTPTQPASPLPSVVVAMLTLPLPLRPEHRLAQLVATAQQSTRSAPHTLLTQLAACSSAKPPWLLQQQRTTTGTGAARPSGLADLGADALPLQSRSQLRQLDEEALRLHCLNAFFAHFAAHHQQQQSAAASDAARSTPTPGASPTVATPSASPTSSPFSPPSLSASPLSLKSPPPPPPPFMALRSPSPLSIKSPTPPPLPVPRECQIMSEAGACTNGQSLAQFQHTKSEHKKLRAFPFCSLIARFVCVCVSAGASPSSCALLLARLLLSCRLPDHLLRLLKWLIESETELRTQREARTADNSTAAATCVKQIDRILAHWSVRNTSGRICVCCSPSCSDRHTPSRTALASLHLVSLVCWLLSGVMEEMAWKTLWRIEQLIKSGSHSHPHTRTSTHARVGMRALRRRWHQASKIVTNVLVLTARSFFLFLPGWRFDQAH